MRFAVNMILKGSKPMKIPVNYRRNCMSLIKEALRPDGIDTDIYRQYYGDRKKNVTKPFTFSLFLPSPTQSSKEAGQSEGDSVFILSDHPIKFFFSSCDPVLLIHVYNGMVNMNKGFSPFPPYSFELKHFSLQKQTPLDSDEIVFKTCSPILVRNIEDKKGKGFISFEHEKFQENLFFSVENLCRNFIDKEYRLNAEQVQIVPVKCKANRIPLYGGEIGTSGIIKIKAPKEVLQLVYDAGLGAKRSQGFGMVEVVKQNCSYL